jgi:hypothetical protein
LPAGTATVTLIEQTAPGERVFDVAINGQTVLHDFDIFAEAGGANVALDETFTVPVIDGQVYVYVPFIFKRLPQGPDALFQAVKVTAGHVDQSLPVCGHRLRGFSRVGVAALHGAALASDHGQRPGGRKKRRAPVGLGDRHDGG